jgi:shikimate kinase
MKNVALIGFMGSGKSTVGVELARRLGVRFVETDTLIEEASNKSVSRIFAEEGERAFRRRERSAIQTVTLETDQVISCGGGVTIDPRNLRLLRMSCRVVLLKADPEVLYERIKKSDSRPLAKNLRTPVDVARLVHERSDAAVRPLCRCRSLLCGRGGRSHRRMGLFPGIRFGHPAASD